MNLERIRIKLIKKPFQNTNDYVLFTRPRPGTPQITCLENSRIPHPREEISRELFDEYSLRSQSEENTEDPEDPDQTYQVLVYPLTNLEDGKS